MMDTFKSSPALDRLIAYATAPDVYDFPTPEQAMELAQELKLWRARDEGRKYGMRGKGEMTC